MAASQSVATTAAPTCQQYNFISLYILLVNLHQGARSILVPTCFVAPSACRSSYRPQSSAFTTRRAGPSAGSVVLTTEKAKSQRQQSQKIPPSRTTTASNLFSRDQILSSKEFEDAVTFVRNIHTEKYKNVEDCPILGPVWKEYNDTDRVRENSEVLELITTKKGIKSFSFSNNTISKPKIGKALRSTFDKLKAQEESKYSANEGVASTSSGAGGFGEQIRNDVNRKKQHQRKQQQTTTSDRRRSARTVGVPRGAARKVGSMPSAISQASLGPSPSHLTPPYRFNDSEMCYITHGSTPLFTPEECRAIIDDAENDTEWKPQAAFYNSNHATKRMETLSDKSKNWFGRACIEKIFPLLQHCFPDASSSKDNPITSVHQFRLFGAKVLRYDSDTGENYLGIHSDTSLFTFLIALNDLSEYEGGGTYIEPLGKGLRYDIGHVCIHPGIVRHGGARVEGGVRYAIVGWVDLENVVEYDRRFADEGDLVRLEGRLDRVVQYDQDSSSADSLPLPSSSSSSVLKRLETAERWYSYSLAAGAMYDPTENAQNNKKHASGVPQLTSENAWLGLGQVRLDQERYSEAALAFVKAVDICPFNVRAWTNLGLALTNMEPRDFEGIGMGSGEGVAAAMDAFSVASDLSEVETEPLTNLGLLLSMTGRHDEAAVQFERAIERVKRDGLINKTDNRAIAELYTNYGVTLCDLGRLKASISAFRTALSNDPTFVDAVQNLAAVLAVTGAK